MSHLRNLPVALGMPLAILALSLHPLSARADNTDVARADALFKEARALMAAGKHEQACPKLAESQRLDPGAGTQFRLAECYESTGRVATALGLFEQTIEAARKAGRKDREAQSRRRVDVLRPRVPTLTLVVPKGAAALPGLRVTLDGAELSREAWDRPMGIDPGDHAISAVASGKRPWQQRATIAERAKVSVSVPVLDSLAPAAPISMPAPPPRAPRPSWVVLGAGAGVAALSLGGAIAFTVVSNGKVAAAEALRHDKGLGVSGCWHVQSATCEELQSQNRASDTHHGLAVAGFITAGVVAGATAAYWLWPRTKLGARRGRIDPWLGGGVAGASLSGDF